MAITKKLHKLTITEAASLISAGKLLPSELVDSCLERIEALDDKIKAWALVDREGALEAASRLEQELRRGKPRGRLHGIPIGIKDIFYTAGLRTEAGSRAWSGFVPTYDATTVARLKEAGAIILGKTHTTEGAYFDPAPTHNPWNIAHTPGGSSAGSGAAVAADMCLAALGSQTGGSTLRPAAFNGVVGFKAEYGRISTYGVVALAWTLDHVGILTHTVEDAAIIFQAIAGHDPRDPRSLNAPVPDCLTSLDGQKAPRLGLVRQYFYERADEEMCNHTDSVVEILKQAGARVKEVALPPDFRATRTISSTVVAVEALVYHQEMFIKNEDKYGPRMRQLMEIGGSTPATEYARALQSRLQQRAEIEPLLHEFDALITPGAPGIAPRDLTTTGDPVMQRGWTVVGVPTISLPSGLSKEGLPLAIQLVGPPLAEDHLLAVARWCERALEFNLRPPLD
ncbi:amidase [Chloroflexota bacterium]